MFSSRPVIPLQAMGSPADTDIKLVGVEWMEVPISRHCECKALLTSLANLWPKMLFPFSDRWTPSALSRPHFPKQEIMPAEKGIENQTILTTSRALSPPSNLPSIQKGVGGMSSGWIISDRGTTLNVCQIKVSASGLARWTLCPDCGESTPDIHREETAVQLCVTGETVPVELGRPHCKAHIKGCAETCEIFSYSK